MQFNSAPFALFLPVALAAFVILPPRWRWAFLLGASLAFYGWGEPTMLGFLGAITAITYAAGLALASTRPAVRRVGAIAGLGAVLGSLVAFKFYDFVATELGAAGGPQLPLLGISAPAGYSFYAFMAAAYLIDAWQRRIEPEWHLGRLALYLAWFPKILAGPIERAGAFLPQVRAEPGWDSTRVVGALQLFCWGLFKKVVIADNLAPVVDQAYGIAAYASPLELLIATYFFAFQIYCDFSGYADMAIGVSRLFGIDLGDNFRRPYLSQSVAQFWSQRWHISLGSWFRDYVYIPLGGSRAGLPRQYLNIMIVFVLSGLWHAGLGYGVGWTFLAWGVLNGLYQWAGIATRPLREKTAGQTGLAGAAWIVPLRIVGTFHLILLSWVFFRAASLEDAFLILGKIAQALPGLPALIPHYPFTTDHMLGLALIVLLMGIEVLDERRPLGLRLAALPTPLRWGIYYSVLAGIVLLGRWQGAQFIYMQF